MAAARAAARRPAPLPAAGAVPEPFTPEFFEAVNKGPLEAAYEARNRDPANWNPIPWGLVAIGVLVGLVFALVNVYAALTAGILVGVSWYLLFFVGAILGWHPGTINYVGGASTGASQIAAPIAFVVPAIFLLTTDVLGEAGFFALPAVPSPVALGGFFLVGGALGALWFQTYRRLWIVERPLQYPGAFESAAGLLRMARDRALGERARLREHVFVVVAAGVVAAFVVALRDLAVFGPRGARQAFFDDVFRGAPYSQGFLPGPATSRPFYSGLVYLDPFFLALGWFLRLRVASVLFLGSLVMFLLPFFSPASYAADVPAAAGLFLVWREHARLLAAATVLGAGVVALARLAGPIREGLAAFGSYFAAARGARGRGRVGVWLLGGALGLGLLLLTLGGLPVLGALLVVPLAILLVALLGFVAVKVAGETAVQPITPVVTIGFLFLVLVLQFAGFSAGALLTLGLGAAAFIGAGVIMSTDLFLDTKVGHYIGNPPHRQAIAQWAGLVPGVVVATAAVWLLAPMIVRAGQGEEVPLTAPVGEILAGIGQLALTGEVPWLLIALAFLLGASVEFGSRLGTAFGIGMVLPLAFTFTILLGALGREGYERWWAPAGAGAAGEAGLRARVLAPTGVFVGASLTALLVFAANEWLL